jgi:hypothetical protein
LIPSIASVEQGIIVQPILCDTNPMYIVLKVTTDKPHQICWDTKRQLPLATVRIIKDDMSVMATSIGTSFNTVPIIQMMIQGTTSIVLIDTGAGRSCLSEEMFAKICKPSSLRQTLVSLTGAGQKSLEVLGATNLLVYVGHKASNQEFMVIKNLSRPVILGYPALKALKCMIDATLDKVSFTLKDLTRDYEIVQNISTIDVISTAASKKCIQKDNQTSWPQFIGVTSTMDLQNQKRQAVAKGFIDSAAHDLIEFEEVLTETPSLHKGPLLDSHHSVSESKDPFVPEWTYDIGDHSAYHQSNGNPISVCNTTDSPTWTPADVIHINESLPAFAVERMKRLTVKYDALFSDGKGTPSAIDRSVGEHSITLKPGVKPISQHPRRVSSAH